MSNLVIPDQPTSVTPVRFAGFGIRLLAFLLDSFVLGFVVTLLLGNQIPQNPTDINSAFASKEMAIEAVWTILFWAWIGATPGKVICHIKVVKANGEKIPWWQAILRYLGYLVNILTLFLGFLWIGLDNKKQGWHDKMAKLM